MRRGTITMLLLVAMVLYMAPAAFAQESEQEPSEVTFVHGIRGFIADVYLDDKLILAGFAPERITEPLMLTPGSHRIDLREADAKATSEPAVTKQFNVPAGGKLTAIAHWTGVEDCTITLFDDAGDVVAAGSGKLIARHAAATGSVELALDDRTVDTPLSPARELAESVDPGTHTVAINDRGSNDTVVGSSQVPVDEGARLDLLERVDADARHDYALLADRAVVADRDPLVQAGVRADVAGPAHDRPRQPREAADGVNDDRTGEVVEAHVMQEAVTPFP